MLENVKNFANLLVKVPIPLLPNMHCLHYLIKGPFVDAGAVSIPNEGVILCGGLLGDRKKFVWSNKCYMMDYRRNKLKGTL